MPLRQKYDATAQTSYCTGAYGKLHSSTRSRIKHNLESAFFMLKSRKQGHILLLARFCSFRSFSSVLFRVLLIALFYCKHKSQGWNAGPVYYLSSIYEHQCTTPLCRTLELGFMQGHPLATLWRTCLGHCQASSTVLRCMYTSVKFFECGSPYLERMTCWFDITFIDCAVCARNLCGEVWSHYWRLLPEGMQIAY